MGDKLEEVITFILTKLSYIFKVMHLQVRKDIAELEQLQAQATRQKVKDILSIDIRRLVSDAVKLEEQAKVSSNLTSPTDSNRNVPAGNKCYQVKLNNYGNI